MPEPQPPQTPSQEPPIVEPPSNVVYPPVGQGGTAPPETVEVTVMGQKKMVTIEEAIKAYEKVEGADAKMREAAQMREDAQAGLELQNLWEKFTTGAASPPEIARLGQRMNWTEDEVYEATYGVPMEQSDQEQAGQTTKKNQPQTPIKITEDMFSPELRAKFGLVTETDAQYRQREFENNIKNAIDKNNNFGNITGVLSPENRRQTQDIIAESVKLEVFNQMRLNQNLQLTPELIDRVTQKEVERFVTFRNLTNPEPTQAESNSAYYGPSAPHTIRTPGVPGGGTGTGVTSQVEKPIARVASNDPNYDQNFLDRAKQTIRRFTQGTHNRIS